MKVVKCSLKSLLGIKICSRKHGFKWLIIKYLSYIQCQKTYKMSLIVTDSSLARDIITKVSEDL
jgi:hypothetical protein